jgi:hypothetical protein
MNVFWGLVWLLSQGLLLLLIGVYNVWLSRTLRYEDNPFTGWLSRLLGGAGRARTLTLVAGVLCILFGLIGIIRVVTATL